MEQPEGVGNSGVRLRDLVAMLKAIGSCHGPAQSRGGMGQQAAAFLKGEMKETDVTYAELVKRLKKASRRLRPGSP